jgi:hypothetical protein
MADKETMPPTVNKILGGKGKKLHTHEVHVRRTKNKGYIARHELRDSKGNPPMDGQKSDAEYSLPDKEAMLAHMEQHMGDTSPDQDDEEEQEQGPQAA